MLSRRDIKVDFVYDIETADWTQFVLGGFLDNETQTFKEWDFREEDDYADYLLSLEGNLWAHNGGRFDHKWLLDHCRKRGLSIRVALSGSSIVRGWIGKRLHLFDSYALFKISLADLTNSQNISKAKLGFECVCGRQCGGYCRISRTMNEDDRLKLSTYLEKDCRSLMEAIENVRRYADINDIDLGATVGSSSFRNAKRQLNLQKSDMSASEHSKVRESYYGGRTQVIRPRSDRGFQFDVNSMYASQLYENYLPFGYHWNYYGNSAEKAYEERMPGCYKVNVSVPKMFMPVLPYRTDHRIIFPFGEFSGWYTFPELQYACRMGTKINNIIECVVWNEKRIIFKDWVERIFALRYSANGGKSGPIGTFLKYYLNALTGKLGSNPQMDEIVIDPEIIKPGMSEIEPDCGVFTKPVWRYDDCMHPEWAAYLTSTARIELHRQLTDDGCGGMTAVYCDTDSVFSETNRVKNIGLELGKWKQEKNYRNFIALAPKVYKFDYEDDKFVVRAKGMPVKTLEQFKCISDGGEISSENIVGFRTGAAKGKFFDKEIIVRKLNNIGSNIYGDRILLDDGLTYPMDIKEYFNE